MTPLLTLLIVLVIIGVAMQFLPMDVRIKQIIYVVIVLVLLYWLVTNIGGLKL